MTEDLSGEGIGVAPVGFEAANVETSQPDAGPSEALNPPADWRQSKWLVFIELLIIVSLFVADARGYIPVSKTPFLLLLGWASMWLRKVSWRSVGLKVFRTWKFTIALGLAAGGLLEGLELFITQPLLIHWLGNKPDLDQFRALTGNWKLTLLFLALTWSLAAFGEEMVYRGYLMNRLAGLLNRTRGAWLMSLIAVHVGFGLAHAYQGATGVIDEGLMGLLLGLIYLRTGRNLAVPIVAHGVQDSIDLLLIFLGKYPTM